MAMLEASSAPIHLQPAHRALLLALLARHLPGVTVRVFGSRVADWPASRGVKPYSDLDLAVEERPADLALAALRADLEDSDLPWRVDVCVLDDLPAPLQELIAVQGVVLHEPHEQNNS